MQTRARGASGTMMNAEMRGARARASLSMKILLALMNRNVTSQWERRCILPLARHLPRDKQSAVDGFFFPPPLPFTPNTSQPSQTSGAASTPRIVNLSRPCGTTNRRCSFQMQLLIIRCAVGPLQLYCHQSGGRSARKTCPPREARQRGW